jgi:tetratricopeptide (TPR) repeat protein
LAEAGGGEVVTVDFNLSLPRGARRAGADTGTAGTVFYQKIPDTAKAEFLKGVKSLETNAFDDAVPPLKRAIEIFPDYYDALEMLGTEYVRRGDFPTALPLLTRAVEVNKNGYGYYPLGVALIESKRRDDGIKALQRAVELFPNSINANMRLGKELARDEQRRPEAIKAMENVARLAGKRVPEAYLALASLYSKNQQYREAADAMEIFSQTIPESDTERRGKMKSVVEQLRQKAKSAPAAATSTITSKPSKQ